MWLPASPDNTPAIAPAGAMNKFKDLCPVMYSNVEPWELRQNGAAFDLCDQTFQILTPPGIGSGGPPWFQRAALRHISIPAAR